MVLNQVRLLLFCFLIIDLCAELIIPYTQLVDVT